MVREFITNLNRRRAGLKRFRSSKKILFLTGASAYPFISRTILPYLRDQLRLKVDLFEVPNRFWGETVTVTGLLTGQDLLRSARKAAARYDTVVLPPNCLNPDDLFLDNLTLDQFRQVLNREVIVGSYDLAATIREVCQ
jgi:NifB/MoaA-like Fe-S oxidoreductase